MWLLFLSLSNVAWPFAVGIMRVESEERHVRGYLDYQSGFPAGKDSGFRISEKLPPTAPAMFRWLLNVNMGSREGTVSHKGMP